MSTVGIRDLWRVDTTQLDEPADSPKQKARPRLMFASNEDTIPRRQAIEGKYVLQTSIPVEEFGL